MKNNNKYIKDNLTSDIPIINIVDKIADEITNHFRDYVIPIMYLGMVNGYMQIKKLFENYIKENPELNQELNNLTKSFPFITIQMGLDLYKLSQFLDKNFYKNKMKEEFYPSRRYWFEILSVWYNRASSIDGMPRRFCMSAAAWRAS